MAVSVGSTCPCIEGLGLGHTQVWIIPFVRLVPHFLIHSHGRPARAELAGRVRLAAGDTGVTLATDGAEGCESAGTVPGVQ